MNIRNMFQEDINRKINGVVKVEQGQIEALEMELKEYVITKELKKHFISFFNYYADSFDSPTDDIGVWISGFFGSGKSHFLKILSYILENKSVNGIKTVERFRVKFEDDPATFMMIDKSTKNINDTILFNIDIQGLKNKDSTAVLAVFAKMFYNHLGFYGENLKVVNLEKYLESEGKLEEFKKVFQTKKGKPWIDARKGFAFEGKHITSTLTEVLDISQEDAQQWFKDKSEVPFSIDTFVSDIKEYIQTKPKEYRLLFMVDEVGQYVGTNTDLLLNLQSIVEKIGSELSGRVWVICTGQEAIDEIIKVRSDEFSRIQARFKTRLSLSSSSADEVIQKRILKKTKEASEKLDIVYLNNESVLRNIFTFSDAVLDIKGYNSQEEFVNNFPFVPYQFILMQKVFAEIRKHGNSGKHLSGGERSMLSGFQEAAQALQEKDSNTLAPFYMFYDTVHVFLDSSIRRVIERAEKAAENNQGLKTYDVNILKLLYLIRYIDDIKSNIDNIVILMADNLNIDKITQRENVNQSLNRLLSQNYIGRAGDAYNFLTDEEQDVQREINNTSVDTAEIIDKISKLIFDDIYTTKKVSYQNTYFDFDKAVDGTNIGIPAGNMKIEVLTIASGDIEKEKTRLIMQSSEKAIMVLDETPYYEYIEKAMKIRKYIKQRNISQLAKSMQDIISSQQDEAKNYEERGIDELKRAIEKSICYVNGEVINISGDAKNKIDKTLTNLVSQIYTEIDLIKEHATQDQDIQALLMGTKQLSIDGSGINKDASSKIEEYLTMQSAKKMPTSMSDIQSRYKQRPYGWKDIDIAYLVAELISEQKVTIKHSGETIQPDNLKIIDMLRKQSETKNTLITIRHTINPNKIRQAKEILSDYFEIMDIPTDEDGLIKYIKDEFENKKEEYNILKTRYEKNSYPDKKIVLNAIEYIEKILSQKKDNLSLIDIIISLENRLLDSKEDMEKVISFFDNQVGIFDTAVKLEKKLRDDSNYTEENEIIDDALKNIRKYTFIDVNKFDYTNIPKLNGLINTVKQEHEKLLEKKREELNETVRQCMEEIHKYPRENIEIKNQIQIGDAFFTKIKEEIKNAQTIAILDSKIPLIWSKKDSLTSTMEKIIESTKKQSNTQYKSDGTKENPSRIRETDSIEKKKNIKDYARNILFPAKELSTEEEIDEYLTKISQNMKTLLKDCDAINIVS